MPGRFGRGGRAPRHGGVFFPTQTAADGSIVSTAPAGTVLAPGGWRGSAALGRGGRGFAPQPSVHTSLPTGPNVFGPRASMNKTWVRGMDEEQSTPAS